ncbi:MAG: ABC transporter permease, partial [Lachnospiraceae bacterium]|nr:ABC transporter permease [Lachnospiraceae bacterium]
MLRNNNMQAVSRMAVRSLKNHRRRSFTMITAVLLSVFMLFSVMTVGATYFKMQRLQNIRMSGGDFDAIMYGVTKEQQKTCKENPDVCRMGISAMSGYIAETEFDSTPNVVLMWADDVWWNEIMAPARERLEGRYPVEENEIMVTEYALEKCGFKGLKTGDEFTAVYGAGEKKKEMTFRICGIWDGYGDRSVFFVSEEFYRQTGFSPADVSSGRLCVKFRQRIIPQKMQDEFIESMDLGKQQKVLFTMDSAFSVQILTGIAGLVLITCLCAYLLIYNIMYLSVAGNIRYYGLLQTIGMSGRQIGYLVWRQMLLIGGIGTAGGLMLGSVVSFGVVPSVVKALGIRMGRGGEITVAFHPLILLLTMLIAGITVYIAGRKPV